MDEAKNEELPRAILFACTLNAVRSPMATAIMRHLSGPSVRVESVGVEAGELDPFAVSAMEEIGIALAGHRPRRFDDLKDVTFDLVVALSAEARARAGALMPGTATRVEYWQIPDPTVAEGTREQRLEAYRAVRDDLMKRLQRRFRSRSAPAP